MEKEQVLRHLLSLGYLSSDCRERLFAELVIVRKRRNQFLAKPGQRANKLWFVCRGLVKAYYLSEDNWQRMIAFFGEEEFVLDALLFYNQRGYPYFIECIEDCVFAEIGYDQLLEIIKQYPEYWLVNAKITAISSQKATIKNMVKFRRGAARYDAFKKWHPYHGRIADMDVAAYLGITKWTFSRLKRGK